MRLVCISVSACLEVQKWRLRWPRLDTQRIEIILIWGVILRLHTFWVCNEQMIYMTIKTEKKLWKIMFEVGTSVVVVKWTWTQQTLLLCTFMQFDIWLCMTMLYKILNLFWIVKLFWVFCLCRNISTFIWLFISSYKLIMDGNLMKIMSLSCFNTFFFYFVCQNEAYY